MSDEQKHRVNSGYRSSGVHQILNAAREVLAMAERSQLSPEDRVREFLRLVADSGVPINEPSSSAISEDETHGTSRL
jgi:hypothetical protein